MAQPDFEFRRVDGGAIYPFRYAGERNGKPVWKRSDLDLWCLWVEGTGWAIVDAQGAKLGWPQNPQAALQALPPPGLWSSRKGDKAYVYELVNIH